uniref:Uncharacterized protein n=1 Tax=Solanum lycopersicum TaxID=4081 RepID=A0A3Q7HBF5_SOLLC
MNLTNAHTIGCPARSGGSTQPVMSQAKAHEFVKLMSENGHLKSATMDLQFLKLTDSSCFISSMITVDKLLGLAMLHVTPRTRSIVNNIKNIKFEEPVREESAEQVVQGSYVHL